MSRRTCFPSPATALARVFLPTTTPNRAGSIFPPRFLAPRGGDAFAALSSAARPSPAQQQNLCYRPEPATKQCVRQHGVRARLISTTAAAAAAAGSRPVFRGRGGGGSSNNNNSSKGKGQLPRDKEITHRYVILRQADGSLSQPQPTAEVLASLNRHTESLVALALPKEEDGEDGEDGGEEGLRYPICRIVDRIAERRAESEKAREQRKKAVALKALELNWSIEAHDLDHRLVKLREFLEKGLRVEVTLLRKGKGRNKKQAATQEHAADVVRRIRAVVQAVPGAREVKAADGELLKTLRLLVEGPAKKTADKKDKTKQTAAEAEDAEDGGA